MNINSGDALLTSFWDTDDTKANGTTYGAEIPMGAAARNLEGRVKVRFHVSEAYTGAGDMEIALYSAATTAPTDKIRTVWVGLKTALTLGLTVDVVLGTHEMDKFVRMGVIQTGAATTGAGKGDLVPIKS